MDSRLRQRGCRITDPPCRQRRATRVERLAGFGSRPRSRTGDSACSRSERENPAHGVSRGNRCNKKELFVAERRPFVAQRFNAG